MSTGTDATSGKPNQNVEGGDFTTQFELGYEWDDQWPRFDKNYIVPFAVSGKGIIDQLTKFLRSREV